MAGEGVAEVAFVVVAAFVAVVVVVVVGLVTVGMAAAAVAVVGVGLVTIGPGAFDGDCELQPRGVLQMALVKIIDRKATGLEKL